MSGYTYTIKVDYIKKGIEDAKRASSSFHSKFIESQKRAQEQTKRTSGHLTRMKGYLNQVRAASARAFSRQRVKGYNDELNKSNSIFKRIGAAAAAYIGISSAIRLGTDSLNKFNIQAKADAQLKSALVSTNYAAGRSFEQLAAQATALQGKTLFGDEATEEVQALTLTFKNIKGEIFDQSIPAILDMATAMKVDGKSAAIQLGKALNDPAANLSALSRSGIQFSAVQQKLIKDYQKSNQLAKAQAIILQEVNSQFAGSAAAAAQSGTGKWTQFMNRIGDIQEKFGESLNHTRGYIVDFMNGFLDKAQPVIDAWNNVKAALEPLLPAITSLLIAFGLMSAETSGSSMAVEALSFVLNALAGVLTVAVNGLVGIMTILEPMAPLLKVVAIAVGIYKLAVIGAQAATFLWNVVIAANPIAAVAIALIAFVGIIVTAYQKIGWFRGAMQGAWEGLKTFGQAMKDHVIDSFKKLLSGVTGLMKAFKHLFKGEWSEAWASGKDAVKDLGTGMIGVTPLGAAAAIYKDGKKIGEAIQKGYNKGKSEVDEMDALANSSSSPTDASAAAMKKAAAINDAKSVSDGITTGGKKSNTYNIQIDKLIETINQNVSDGKKSADEIVDMVLDGLTRQLHGSFKGLGQ